MNYPVVDFRKPARVPEDIAQMLSQWQRSAREAIEVRLGRFTGGSLKVGVDPPQPITGEDLRVSADDTIVYQVEITATKTTTLFVIDRPLALAMASEMLGDTLDALPETRQPTDIESTCLDLFMEEINSLILTNQHLSPRLTMKVVGTEKLKEMHSEFPANATNSMLGYRFELPYGEGLLRWIIPQDATLDMLAASEKSTSSDEKTRENLERLVLNAPSAVSVQLGKTQILLSKLGNLAPGDIIVLDQKIDEPLTANIGGQPIFLGWCGKNGKQQVFQIDELFVHEATKT